ncbi:SMK killer toxin resistance protein [Myotisia sp. PD_48]|nr:SMK killer toxin resistance protein [Myotisia sp. PD_48]
MASFAENLWSSIFTPGATPTLLIATNVTFAALQLLFFALLIATYSIHFIILSFLCAALWASINWFASEIETARLEEEQKKKDVTKNPEKKAESSQATRMSPPGALDTTESETETESLLEGGSTGRSLPTSALPRGAVASARRSPVPAPIARRTTPSATGAQPGPNEGGAEELRKRTSPRDSSGYISTDSEWEKVDEKDR